MGITFSARSKWQTDVIRKGGLSINFAHACISWSDAIPNVLKHIHFKNITNDSRLLYCYREVYQKSIELFYIVWFRYLLQIHESTTMLVSFSSTFLGTLEQCIILTEGTKQKKKCHWCQAHTTWLLNQKSHCFNANIRQDTESWKMLIHTSTFY